MKPLRPVSRRSFLLSVGGAAFAGTALAAVTGRAAAGQVSDHDSGPRADFPGQGRGPLNEPGDSDYANPQPMGDTFQSDPAPGRVTGRTDSDGGPAADLPGQGVGSGSARTRGRAERCTGIRRRIARYEAMGSRTERQETGLELMRRHLTGWGCG
jgi:hypothetical protein